MISVIATHNNSYWSTQLSLRRWDKLWFKAYENILSFYLDVNKWKDLGEPNVGYTDDNINWYRPNSLQY